MVGSVDSGKSVGTFGNTAYTTNQKFEALTKTLSDWTKSIQEEELRFKEWATEYGGGYENEDAAMNYFQDEMTGDEALHLDVVDVIVQDMQSQLVEQQIGYLQETMKKLADLSKDTHNNENGASA